MERVRKSPKKCPSCNSTRINMNEDQDIRCPSCGYKNLSTSSIQKIQENNEKVENNY